jgi:uncharacterized protein (DUF362 family)
LVDLEKDRFVQKKVLVDGPFRSLDIAQTVLECDFLVNVPVMKAHSETLLTCSLKNLKGVMPRRMKTAFHGVDLHRAIAQLASVLSPDLIVVDGLQGDLSSETGRTPIAMETMLLGTNPVEVDAVAADMLGYAPRTIRHIAHSEDIGLGTSSLDRISVHAVNRPTRRARIVPAPHYTRRFPCKVLSKRHHFLVGQKSGTTPGTGEMRIAIGECAVKQVDADVKIDKCPPSASSIYQRLASAVRHR